MADLFETSFMDQLFNVDLDDDDAGQLETPPPPPKKKRFADPLTEDDITTMIDSKIPTSTIEKEKWAMSLFRKWQRNRNSNGIITGLHVFTEMENMTAVELDYLLSFFVLEVRNQNGKY